MEMCILCTAYDTQSYCTLVIVSRSLSVLPVASLTATSRYFQITYFHPKVSAVFCNLHASLAILFLSIMKFDVPRLQIQLILELSRRSLLGPVW